jgi:hypothetical protein
VNRSAEISPSCNTTQQFASQTETLAFMLRRMEEDRILKEDQEVNQETYGKKR